MRSAALLLAAVAALPLFAQSRMPQASETIEVSIVNVDVFVTDKQGNRVRGLTKNDFEIREGGRVQPITNFAEYSSVANESLRVEGVAPAEAPAPARAAAPAPRQKRVIVLFVEWFTLPEFRTKPMFEAMRQFVRETVRPGDALSIVTWANVPKVRLELTDDVAAIEKTITEIEMESSGVNAEAARTLYARQQDAMARQWTTAVNSMSTSRGIRAMDVRSQNPFDVEALIRLEYFKIRQKANAVNALMQSISALEGRKIVLMATQRFGHFAGLQYTGTFVGKPEYNTREIRDSVTRTANANGITLYTMYPAGMDSTFEGADQTRANIFQNDSDVDAQKNAYDNNIAMNETSSLNELAEKTGGQMAWGAQDVVSLLPRIGEDLDNYYSLAYRTTSSRADRTAAIEVRTKNPAYVVRARRQYVEKSDETKMGDRVIAGLFRPSSASVIPVDATVGEPKQAGRARWIVPLKIRVPIDRLLTLEGNGGGVRGEFSVFVASGGVFGVITDVVKRTQPFTIAKSDLARAQGSHFTYDFDLRIDDITSRVSIGVLDEISKDYGLKVLELPERETANGR